MIDGRQRHPLRLMKLNCNPFNTLLLSSLLEGFIAFAWFPA